MSDPPDARPRFVQDWWPEPAPRQPITNGVAPGQNTPYVRAAFAAELAALQATPEGERNRQLNTAAMKLGQLVASGHLLELDVRAALFDMGVQVGLTETETRATLASGIAKGLTEPRAVPAPSSPTVYPEVTVLDWKAPEVASELADVISERFPTVPWPDAWSEDGDLGEWVVYPLIPARRIVALFSPPKIGKSLLVLELAVAISRGKPVLGHTPDKARRVLYVDFENDPRGDVVPRLKAMGLSADQLGGLLYLSFPPLPPLDTRQGGAELLAVAQHYGAEVIIIDTISRAVQGEENDNDTWLNFYRCTGQLLKAAGITTLRLDHTGKDTSKGMRGGSAKSGDVDVAWSMTRVTDTKLQLECVANRLPIPDRLVLLTRDSSPLAHHVETGSVFLSKVDACAKALDALDFPIGEGPGTGRDAALDRLEESGDRGDYSKEVVRQAVAQRKHRVVELRPRGPE